MVGLVETMLKLHNDLPKARTAPDRTAIERQIAATDIESSIVDSLNVHRREKKECRVD
jgi:hypothetical protein